MADATCSQCSRPVQARGLCNTHYFNARAAGMPKLPVPSIEERFWAKVDVAGVCWEWTGSRGELGYGNFNATKTSRWRAHRWAWTNLVGPVPDGLHLDHLCRNPPCVNPDHLEPVTNRENGLRGAAGKRNAAKTHCPQKHPYSGDNLIIRPRGGRACRECQRVAIRRHKDKVKAERPGR